MIYLYAIYLDGKFSKEKLEELIKYIGGEKYKRIIRLKRSEDILRSVMGELLSKISLMKQFGINYNGIEFENGEFGKPLIKGNEKMFFNISHSGKIILCAVGESELGVDIEEIKRIDLNGVGKIFLFGDEYRKLLELPVKKKEEYFYKMWTIKESYVKAIGEGLYMDLSMVKVNMKENKVGYKGNVFNFKEIYVDDKYKACICGKEDIETSKISVYSCNEIYEIITEKCR